MLKRRPRELKHTDRLRSPAHRAWVRREWMCIVPGCIRQPVEAAHVRLGLPAGEQGGIGLKPSDCWIVALCGGPDGHHAEQHRAGERVFAQKYKLDLVKEAADLWRMSPARLRAKGMT